VNDGAETAAAILAELAWHAVPARQDIADPLAARNCLRSDWSGWLRLEVCMTRNATLFRVP
jgi:hypothetical protein